MPRPTALTLLLAVVLLAGLLLAPRASALPGRDPGPPLPGPLTAAAVARLSRAEAQAVARALHAAGGDWRMVAALRHGLPFSWDARDPPATCPDACPHQCDPHGCLACPPGMVPTFGRRVSCAPGPGLAVRQPPGRTHEQHPSARLESHTGHAPVAAAYQPCPEHCFQCTSPTSCQQCNTSYYLANDTCHRCIDNCRICFGPDTCDTCASFYLQHQGQCVVECPGGFYSTGSRCQSCGDHCAACSSPTTCSACQSDYLRHDAACVAQCPTSYYPEEGNCRRCSAKCAACANASDNCTACPTGQVLQAGACVSACSAGHFPQSGHCQPCDESCATCAGTADACTTCPEGKLLQAGACVGACSAGFFESGGACSACPANCTACSSGTNCTACASNYLRHNGGCVASCPSGFFAASGACSACSANCTACSSGSNCTACASNYLRHNGGCVSSCPSGFFASGGACSACSANCSVCTSATQCTACTANHSLHGDVCVAACPDGFFDAGGACSPCPGTCSSCTSASNCTACAGGRLLHAGACVSACPSGFFANGLVCSACSAGCHACSSATNCTACTSGLLLHKQACVASCPSGFFASGSACAACSASCDACSSEQVCTGCQAGFFLHQDVCVAACPSSFFGSNGACLSCSANCTACTSATNCTTCASNYLRHNGGCVASCPSGFFVSDGSCAACSASCDTCASATECMVCHPGSLKHDGGCVAACPSGFFADGTACAACSADCAVCSSPSTCSTCTAGHYLHHGSCVAACPTGTWPDASSGACTPCPAGCTACASGSQCTDCLDRHFLHPSTGLCQPCNISCAACASGTACTACQPGLVFLETDPQADSLCGAACSPGEYVGPGRCAACDSSCALCTGAPDACQVCAAGYRWSAQPPGPGATGPCVPCPEGCVSCTASMCLSCDAGLFLTPTGGCSAACPAKMYGDAPSASCQPCDPGCAECLGPGDDECTACIGGLEAIPAATAPHACVSPCPSGEFRQPGTTACQPCDGACAECTGPTDQDCWRCEGTHLQEGECVQECAPKHVPQGGRCLPCHLSCDTCSGTRSTQCTGACPPGLVALPQEGGLMSCVANCPIGYTRSSTECVKCAAHCASCPGPANACGQCERGWFLNDAQCVATCPSPSIPQGNSCLVCHPLCGSCFGPGPGECLTCTEDAPLLHEHGCFAACPAGTFQSAQACLYCSPTCATCSGPASHQCTSCPAGKTLASDGTCIDACPAGQYVELTDDRGRVCRSCSALCQLCDGPGEDQCTACPGALLLEAGRCVGSCSAGHAACQAQASCLPCPAGCSACTHEQADGSACSAWCTACDEDLLLSPLTGTCGQMCPPGEVRPPASSADAALCQPCAPECATCHEHASRCTSCADGAHWLLPDTGECASGCPSLRQAPSPREQVCLACPKHCEACAPGGGMPACTILPGGALNCPTVPSCLRCEAPYLLLEDGTSCVSACPAGFFDDHEAAVPVCGPCHSSCATCMGPGKTDCLTNSPEASRRMHLAVGLGVGLSLLLLLVLLLLALCLLRRFRQGAPKDSDVPDENATVLNTIVELSLPGAALVTLATEFLALGEDELGSGTQASVFAARAIGTGVMTRLGCPETVAIKQLKSGTADAAHLSLLQNEIALMWLLRDQANIARIYGYSDQPPAIVMERFDTDLAGLLHSEVDLPLRTRLDLATQWAAGLEAMHASGIVHCDLKSVNVLVALKPDGAWHAALGDLGTSRNLHTDRASALVSTGPELNALTVLYAAPELIEAFQQRRSLDAALYFPADIYAAAILLWECVARAKPWPGAPVDRVIACVLHGDRPDLKLATGPVAQASPALAQNLADALPLLWAAEPASRPPVATLRHTVATLAAMLPASQ